MPTCKLFLVVLPASLSHRAQRQGIAKTQAQISAEAAAQQGEEAGVGKEKIIFLIQAQTPKKVTFPLKKRGERYAKFQTDLLGTTTAGAHPDPVKIEERADCVCQTGMQGLREITAIWKRTWGFAEQGKGGRSAVNWGKEALWWMHRTA